MFHYKEIVNCISIKENISSRSIIGTRILFSCYWLLILMSLCNNANFSANGSVQLEMFYYKEILNCISIMKITAQVSISLVRGFYFSGY